MRGIPITVAYLLDASGRRHPMSLSNPVVEAAEASRAGQGYAFRPGGDSHPDLCLPGDHGAWESAALGPDIGGLLQEVEAEAQA